MIERINSLRTTIRNILNREFIRFLFTGAINTLVGYAIYSGAYWVFNHEGIALVFDYVIGAIFNYSSYSTLVFRKYKTKRFLIFCAVYVLTYFLNYGLVAGIMRASHLNAYIAQIFALTVCPLVLYMLLKKIVFINNQIATENVSQKVNS
jgi:putative flippase GtrA